jgi:hypothetical protein
LAHWQRSTLCPAFNFIILASKRERIPETQIALSLGCVGNNEMRRPTYLELSQKPDLNAEITMHNTGHGHFRNELTAHRAKPDEPS